jgi:hypothetical protein
MRIVDAAAHHTEQRLTMRQADDATVSVRDEETSADERYQPASHSNGDNARAVKHVNVWNG